MKVVWKGGMAQWVLFGIIAAVIGMVVLVLAVLGLAACVLLAGFFSAAAALASRRRRNGASRWAARKECPVDRSEPGDRCVDLDKDSYTVRIVDTKKPL